MNRLAAIAMALVAAAGAVQAADPVVVSPPGRKAMAPEIAVAPDGALVVLWLERTPAGDAGQGNHNQAAADLWLARSVDGGASFGAPVRVNATPGAVWGFPVSKPRVAVSPAGVVHVFHAGNAQHARTGKPLVLPLYTRSTDGGRSFGEPRVLGGMPDARLGSPVEGSDIAELFGTLAIDGRGGVYAYWIDTRAMTKEQPNGKVWSAVSLDDGVTFGAEFEVLPADTCPCCQLTTATQDGRVFLGSRRVNPEGTRDSTVAVSIDRGRTFAARVRWGGTPWKIEACPLKATALAVDGEFVYTAAFDGGASPQGAAWSRSSDGGRSFEPARPLHATATVSDAPVLALAGEALVAAWHAKAGGAERRVFVAVSRDRGRSFSAPVEVPAPAGNGTYPVLTARAGGVQLAWQQADAILTRYLAADDPLFGNPPERKP
ncbi:MAG: exo-alpha-sialidase [Gammaproteobacteria bacterium]|nr:exo-alpha-sialidase [Gammaproteobacteria bacterium]